MRAVAMGLTRQSFHVRPIRALVLGASLLALAACEQDGSFDLDFRQFGRGGLDTTDAARQATADRPQPDARGVISYPGYQVAVARQGDTVESVAARVGLQANELGNYNAIGPNTQLRQGEVLALPRRVSEPAPPIGSLPQPGSTAAGGAINVSTIASGAIDRAEAASPRPVAVAPAAVATR
mgnify:FL=1